MTFTITQMDVAACPELRISVYSPADQETWGLLRRISCHMPGAPDKMSGWIRQ